jgi:DNA mismatch repair protein MutL
MGRVRVLPEEVRARIAAGEFITSPRAVLKELVENSLDAGAREVRVWWGDGGFSLTVADDGEGITKDDLPEVFKRFATSKISRLDQLVAIATFGFRGEALYAISSVSRGRVVSKTEESELAWELPFEFGRVGEVKPAARERGTTVEVRSLFQNYPVRRLEAEKRFKPGSLLQLLSLYALFNPKVRFFVSTESLREELSSPISHLLPRGLEEGSLLKGVSVGEVEVEVLLSPPEKFFSSGRWIFLGVNGRPVRNATVLAAVRKGSAPYLPSYKYPFAVISLKSPPSQVDFNLHPGKEEVDFRDERTVFAAVVEALGRAYSEYERRRERSISATFPPSQEKASVEVSEPVPLFEVEEEEGSEEVEILAQLHLTYILARVGDKYLLFDQHALCERLNYNSILRGGRRSQPLLFPVLLPFNGELEDQHLTAFRRLGFTVRRAEGGVELLGVPEIYSDHRGVALFTRLLSAVEGGEFAESSDVLRDVACKSSIKAGEPLSREEARRLVLHWLKEKGEKFTCPHGRNLVVELDTAFLERLFGR